MLQPVSQFARLLAVVLFLSHFRTSDASNEDSRQARAASLTYSKELFTHDKNDDTDSRRYDDLTVLGFVTPWNSKGTDIALKQASRGRLDLVSPVTWQMHPTGLAGGQDFDESFYKDIAKSGSRVYPRILFERWTLEDFTGLKADPDPMVQRIVQMCERNSVDGVVLEIWQSLLAVGALQGPGLDSFVHLVKDLGEGLRKEGVHAVLVLPPYTRPHRGLEEAHFEDLQVAFNHFVIMTYDFSGPRSQPGPMAPIPWVKDAATFFSQKCNLGRKVLVGLNFYGLNFKAHKDDDSDGRHVQGHEYIELLKEHKPQLRWSDEVAEHFFFYSENGQERFVLFPTRFSIAQRVATAKEVGCGGVAIWELGQGLDHFFDEF